MQTFVLGRPERADREDVLRGGAIAFRSRRGLRPVDRLLVEALPKKAPVRLLTGLDTEGAVALAAHAVYSDAALRWFHLDLYVATRVRETLAANGLESPDTVVGPDLPGFRGRSGGDVAPVSYDLIALPFPSGGEA